MGNCTHCLAILAQGIGHPNFCCTDVVIVGRLGCMSLVPFGFELEGTEDSAAFIGLLVTVAAGGLTIVTWAFSNCCCPKHRGTRQVTLPSGIVISYGGPSAR